MRVGVLFAYMDYDRLGAHHRGMLQPQIGPLIAALLPSDVDVEVINDAWRDPDWNRDYDLMFISCAHSDFDRARQISHYWRRRGAKTVFGGILASTFPDLCRPYFDVIAIGDPETTVPRVYADFASGRLQPEYRSLPHDPATTPTPRFDLIADQALLPISFEASRGCPFSCEFCALTAFGTRYHARPPELVISDIARGQEMLDGLVPFYKRQAVVFLDNNLGGSLPFLFKLSERLQSLNIRWGAAVTVNVLHDEAAIAALARSGCVYLFTGLESFNTAALRDMRKFHNIVGEAARAFDLCRRHGILLSTGLMLSPRLDDLRYLERLPDLIHACRLYVPTFICFEAPIPGTPHFRRLADKSPSVMLPNALLRDFTGYTLVVHPAYATAKAFVDGYVALLEATYTVGAKLQKIWSEVPGWLHHGQWEPALLDIAYLLTFVYTRPHPQRTYLAGNDVEPPEMHAVPFTDDDFASEAERRDILEPMRVTDECGQVLSEWQSASAAVSRSVSVAAI